MRSGDNLLEVLGKDPNAVIRHGQEKGQRITGTMPTAIDELPGSKDDDLLARSPVASTGTSSDSSLNSSNNGSGASSASNGSQSTSTVEPVTSKQTNTDWTMESLQAEMRKAREEAKRHRLEKQDSIERLRKEYDAKLEEIKSSSKALEDQAKELADLKAREADNKKTLAEKLADRELRLSEREAEIARIKEAHNRELFSIRAELENYKAEINVQNQFYQDKLTEELNDIPDRFKDLADRLIKGCDSVREQVDVLREAKDKGLFKDKTTIVSHAVPDINEGARLSSSSQKQEEERKRKSLSSNEKIGSALKNLKGNPIFRGK
jgi:DNA repair exonuclease SbcCD ATPase subunit